MANVGRVLVHSPKAHLDWSFTLCTGPKHAPPVHFLLHDRIRLNLPVKQRLDVNNCSCLLIGGL